MTRMVIFLSPSCLEDILQINLWWQTKYKGLYFGITMDRGFVLYIEGLRYCQDSWDLGRNDLLEWEEACTKFSLADVYC